MSEYGSNYTDEHIVLIKKKFEKEYRQAINELEEKARDYFEKHKDEIDNMLEKLERNEISEELYQNWFMNRFGSGIWYNQLADELANDMLTINERCCEIANKEIIGTYAENLAYETFKIEKELQIDTSFALVKEGTVRQLIKEDRLLLPLMEMNKTKDIAWNIKNVNSQVLQSVLQGEDLFQLRDRFRNIAHMNINVAYSRARTAMTCAQNMGSLDSIERAKELGIKVKKQWLATADDRTRPTHVLLDGETKETDEPFSNGLMFPGDPSGSLDEVMNCRCDMLSVVDDDLSDIDWSICSERINDTNMTYEDWKAEAALQVAQEESWYE
jgi:hypothetical protein